MDEPRELPGDAAAEAAWELITRGQMLAAKLRERLRTQVADPVREYVNFHPGMRVRPVLHQTYTDSMQREELCWDKRRLEAPPAGFDQPDAVALAPDSGDPLPAAKVEDYLHLVFNFKTLMQEAADASLSHAVIFSGGILDGAGSLPTIVPRDALGYVGHRLAKECPSILFADQRNSMISQPLTVNNQHWVLHVNQKRSGYWDAYTFWVDGRKVETKEQIRAILGDLRTLMAAGQEMEATNRARAQQEKVAQALEIARTLVD